MENHENTMAGEENADGSDKPNRRILIIDDEPTIHRDFKKILHFQRTTTQDLDALEASVFGHTEAKTPVNAHFEIDSAFQGNDGVKMVRDALESGSPYAMAFVDVRMPPGINGVETTHQIFGQDSDIQIVICTAHADYSWGKILERLKASERLLILKKPFESIEVLQIASALCDKWRLLREKDFHLELLEYSVEAKSAEVLEAEAIIQRLEHELTYTKMNISNRVHKIQKLIRNSQSEPSNDMDEVLDSLDDILMFLDKSGSVPPGSTPPGS